MRWNKTCHAWRKPCFRLFHDSCSVMAIHLKPWVSVIPRFSQNKKNDRFGVSTPSGAVAPGSASPGQSISR